VVERLVTAGQWQSGVPDITIVMEQVAACLRPVPRARPPERIADRGDGDGLAVDTATADVLKAPASETRQKVMQQFAAAPN
jgi:hypothetical protein